MSLHAKMWLNFLCQHEYNYVFTNRFDLLYMRSTSIYWSINWLYLNVFCHGFGYRIGRYLDNEAGFSKESEIKLRHSVQYWQNYGKDRIAVYYYKKSLLYRKYPFEIMSYIISFVLYPTFL